MEHRLKPGSKPRDDQMEHGLSHRPPVDNAKRREASSGWEIPGVKRIGSFPPLPPRPPTRCEWKTCDAWLVVG